MSITTSTNDRPLILVSNDDGVGARGLDVLAAELRQDFDVVVVAPDRERSAVSHGVNLKGRWAYRRVAPGVFAVGGTPADCVYLGMCQLAPRPPALVVSGVNNGFNLGTDVIYSGTVAAAAEGVVLGVPGIAISAESGSTLPTFELAARFGRALVRWVVDTGWAPPNTLLSVNVPANASTNRFAVGGMGQRRYRQPERADGPLAPEGEIQLFRPFAAGTEGATGPDAEIVRQGVVSVSPLRLDWTARSELDLSERLTPDGFESIGAGPGAGKGAGKGARPGAVKGTGDGQGH